MTITTRRAAAAMATLALAGGAGASLALAGTQNGIEPWEVAQFQQRTALIQADPAARLGVNLDVMLAKRRPASGARVLSAQTLRPQVSLDVLLARLRSSAR